MYNVNVRFEYDETKNQANIAKHGLSFADAKAAFSDKKALYAIDEPHSTVDETRHICIGKIGDKIATVIFTVRDGKIRIISAGFYRKGRKIYEQNR